MDHRIRMLELLWGNFLDAKIKLRMSNTLQDYNSAVVKREYSEMYKVQQLLILQALMRTKTYYIASYLSVG